MRWFAIAAIVLAVVALCGCSGTQDDVIGRGPAALVFTGDGEETTYIKVSWQGDSGEWLSKSFTVYSQGRVELRLEDRLTYYVSLDPACSSAATASVEKQNEVIAVGGNDAE